MIYNGCKYNIFFLSDVKKYKKKVKVFKNSELQGK